MPEDMARNRYTPDYNPGQPSTKTLLPVRYMLYSAYGLTGHAVVLSCCQQLCETKSHGTCRDMFQNILLQ